MSTIRRSTLLVASLFTAFTGLAAFETKEASADVRIRVGGHARVRVGGGHRRVHYRVRRPAPPRVRIHVGGAIWVGGGYRHRVRYSAPPPPVVESCDCDNSYYPVVPESSSTAVYVAPVRPRLPRWGLGLAAGGVSVQDQDAGDDLAILGRLRLTPGLLLEGEIGKSELADGTRVDRRLGASLVYELGVYNRWAPYVVGGIGATQVEVGDGAYETSQNFAELGVGLRLAVTPKVHVAADIRAGSRSATEEPMPLDAQYRVATPPAEESEEYTRARLSAVLYF